MTSRYQVTTRDAGLFSHNFTNSKPAQVEAAITSAIDLSKATADELRTYRLNVLTGLHQTLNKGTIAKDMGTTLQSQLALLVQIETRLVDLKQPVTNDSDAQDLLEKVKAVVPTAARAV